MGVDVSCLTRIEEVSTNLLELDSLKHTVEKYFQKDKHVIVLLCNVLNPSYFDIVLHFVKSCFHGRDLWRVFKRVDATSTKEDEEAKIFIA